MKVVYADNILQYQISAFNEWRI